MVPCMLNGKNEEGFRLLETDLCTDGGAQCDVVDAVGKLRVRVVRHDIATRHRVGKGGGCDLQWLAYSKGTAEPWTHIKWRLDNDLVQ
jgi:hypothetical protein